ncbi:hypothetical protein F5X99DRAFT_11993 [Biscogniauxia marginata]|nr:hypothetical protein F5X99DRAFT_11993 [Biscogniauxia marginata]
MQLASGVLRTNRVVIHSLVYCFFFLLGTPTSPRELIISTFFLYHVYVHKFLATVIRAFAHWYGNLAFEIHTVRFILF